MKKIPTLFTRGQHPPYHKGYDAAMRECESPPPVLLSVRDYNELPADRRAIVDEWLQANGLHVNHVRSVVNATTVKAPDARRAWQHQDNRGRRFRLPPRDSLTLPGGGPCQVVADRLP